MGDLKRTQLVAAHRYDVWLDMFSGFSKDNSALMSSDKKAPLGRGFSRRFFYTLGLVSVYSLCRKIKAA
jgi:hypothetical protein